MLLYLGIAILAGATIVYEVALTRIFSIAYGYHFAFLAMSLGLLGFGMSGTMISLRPAWRQRLNGARLGWLSIASSTTFFAGYLVANFIPLDPYRVGWDPTQLPILATYLLAYALPFLLAGLVQGLPITTWPERAGRIYAASLAGSGLGGLLALMSLERLVAPSALTAAAGGAALSALLLGRVGFDGSGPGLSAPKTLTGAAVASAVALALVTFAQPAWLGVRMSEYKPLPQLLQYPDARVVLSAANAQSQVDVVDSSSVHSAPGLSLTYPGSLPRQSALVIDGERVLPVTRADDLEPDFLEALPSALVYRLKPEARTLVLEPGGGLEVASALHGAAASVTALEVNPLLTELLRGPLASRSGELFRDPRVRLISTNPRSYLASEQAGFDVISLALSENRRSVAAGAFSISENYLMTQQAIDTYLDHLLPGGILVMHRWLQLPPTEELRSGALLIEGLERDGADAGRHLIALRSFSTMLILAKNEPFTGEEIAQTTSFAAGSQLDLVHYPGIRPEETNRWNVLQNDRYHEAFQAMLEDREAFFRDYEYEVRAPSDDRPFFFHFFKWAQIPTVLSLMGRTWQPFGGSGYLLVLGLLVVITVLAAVMILLPAVILRRQKATLPGIRSLQVVSYFAMLGLGFLMIEVALVGRFLLVLNHSALAFTMVLFGLLVFSGLGSFLSARVPWRPALAALVVLTGFYALSLSTVLQALLRFGLPIRILATVALLAPVGVLMGVAFPKGIRRLSEDQPAMLPMAWGVNGFTSVIGAVLAALVSLSWGYSVVLGAGGLAYLLALTFIWKSPGKAAGG